MRRKAFTLVELLLVFAIFGLLSGLLWFALRNVSDLWRKSDAKDDAVRELVKARDSLTRDLLNASASRSGRARVAAHLGSGYDGDAISFLSTDSGLSGHQWNLDSQGKPLMAAQLTYYLVVPDPPGEVTAGPPDADGYEQQDPYKWLIRRVDPGSEVLNPAWTSWLIRPNLSATGPSLTAVSRRMLGFRVLDSGALWNIEISAVAIKDARHSGPLGNMPLRDGPYTLVDRFSVRTENP